MSLTRADNDHAVASVSSVMTAQSQSLNKEKDQRKDFSRFATDERSDLVPAITSSIRQNPLTPLAQRLGYCLAVNGDGS